MAKEGSTISGMMTQWLRDLDRAAIRRAAAGAGGQVSAHTRFEPAVSPRSQDIPFAKSVIDIFFRWLSMKS